MISSIMVKVPQCLVAEFMPDDMICNHILKIHNGYILLWKIWKNRSKYPIGIADNEY